MNFNFNKLAECWPSPVVSRTGIEQFSGGLLNSKLMANLDSIGAGPPRGRCGKKIFYPVDTLVIWLEQRARKVGSR